MYFVHFLFFGASACVCPLVTFLLFFNFKFLLKYNIHRGKGLYKFTAHRIVLFRNGIMYYVFFCVWLFGGLSLSFEVFLYLNILVINCIFSLLYTILLCGCNPISIYNLWYEYIVYIINPITMSYMVFSFSFKIIFQQCHFQAFLRYNWRIKTAPIEVMQLDDLIEGCIV